MWGWQIIPREWRATQGIRVGLGCREGLVCWQIMPRERRVTLAIKVVVGVQGGAWEGWQT